jgi:VanZ family protein
MVRKVSTIYIVRAVLIALTLVMLCCVLRNGLASGEASAAQSHSVTETVQEVVGAIDPDSPIATATGAEFDLLHACVRNFAHFFEYFLLALFACGSFLSFVCPGRWKFSFIPPCFVGLTIAVDEWLQSLTAGRAGQLSDVLVDSLGALLGLGLALLVYGAVQYILIRRKRV